MNEIQRIRGKTGLSQSKFADLFSIPVRTIQKWEIGQATPPQYVYKMMKDILLMKQTIDVRNSKKLPAYLYSYFWDCDIDKLDLVKNSDFIISRLYNFADIEARAWVNMHYDKETIIKAACNRRDLDPIVANYLMKEFKLDARNMAYYKREINKINWKGE